MTLRALAVNVPPASVIFVVADAFKFDNTPFEMTIPGLAELPSTRLKLRPVPKFRLAFPKTVTVSGEATYVTVRALALKLPPASVIFVVADALRFDSEPFEMTMPGLAELPSTSERFLPEPKFRLAFP